MKFGELLVEDGVITQDQLNNALDLQKDNPKVPIGEIFLTQGVLTREQLLAYIEKMIFTTGVIPDMAIEMLDQEEIDKIMRNAELKKEKNTEN